MKQFSHILHYFDKIPQPFISRYSRNQEIYNQARTLFWFISIFSLAYIYFFSLAIVWNSKPIIWVFAVGSIFFVTFFPALWFFSKAFTGLYVMMICNFILIALSVMEGGIKSPPSVWIFTVLPAASFGILESKIATKITIFFLIEILGLYVELNNLLPPNSIPPESILFYYIAAWLGGGLLIFAFLALTDFERKKSRNIIEQAHLEVLALKNQQDSDYFLTKLIVNPLFKNSNICENIKIQFFSRQKKVFCIKIKKWI